MGEFELIRRHFVRPAPANAHVVLGIGDDAALLQPSPGQQWAISSDMLVAGRHFFPDVSPEALGHKTLAVNLSDLAAMGARPVGFTLALALPQADDAWLSAFAQGLFTLADEHGCRLIGGDTTRGPLNLCVTVMGEVAPGQALRRDAAQAGDDLYMSGGLGAAHLALAWLQGEAWAHQAIGPTLPDVLRARLERPAPRVALGQALVGVAHAAMDLSDGLAGDVQHLLTASGCGAVIDLDAASQDTALLTLPTELRQRCAAVGGDDYELLFTAAPAQRAAVHAAAERSQTPVTRIGQLTKGKGVEWQNADGQRLTAGWQSFDHFAQ
jgi:thiamine-monophosphate kinase